MPTGLYVIGSRAEVDGAVARNLMTASLVVQVADGAQAGGGGGRRHGGDPPRWSVAGGASRSAFSVREDRAVVRRFVKPVPADATVVDGQGRAVAMAGEAVFEQATGAPDPGRAAGVARLRGAHRLDLGQPQSCSWARWWRWAVPTATIPAVLRMEDTRMNYGG